MTRLKTISTRLALVFLVIIVSFLAFLPDTLTAAAPSDVVGRTCSRDVEKLQYIGVISGYEDGTFRPDNPIRRSEIAKIIVVCRNLEQRATQLKGPTRFPDVPADHWASGFINAAVETGIITGYTDGGFKPDRNVTYAEALTMLIRAIGHAPTDGVWPDNYVGVAASLGLSKGLAFDQSAGATRGDVAMMASRAVFTVAHPTAGATLGQAFGVDRDSVVHFIDVGQGDAILVVTPAKNALLVDGGTNSAAPNLLAYISALHLPDIDAAVISHAHADHIGGMDEVLDAFSVGRFYDSGYAYDSVGYRGLLAQVQALDTTYHTVKRGDQIEIDPWIDVVLVHPFTLGADCNDNSVVLKVIIGDVSFFLSGDAETAAETEISLQSAVKPEADILKVGHHGSTTSTSSTLLSILSPQVALISVGEGNSYGHPAESTMTTLVAAGAAVFRTDTNGSVTVTTDGSTYTVVSEDGLVMVGLGSGATLPSTPIPTTTKCTISTAGAPSYGGSVSGAGFYEPGETATLSAAAASGYSFSKWTDGGTTVSTSAVYSFSVTKSRSLTAVFEAAVQQNYIGNRNTKKFHSPYCSYLPDPQNRVYFATREDAIRAGYVPCQKCNP